MPAARAALLAHTPWGGKAAWRYRLKKKLPVRVCRTQVMAPVCCKRSHASDLVPLLRTCPHARPAERPDPMRDCILLCACGESELLPQNPDLPADTFTSCLTTPIKVCLPACFLWLPQQRLGALLCTTARPTACSAWLYAAVGFVLRELTLSSLCRQSSVKAQA